MVRYVCAGSDPNIVHVDSDSHAERFMFEDDVAIDVIHHRLECCWRIGESKVHDRRLKKSVSGFKRCLLFVSFANAYVVIPPANIELRVDVCVAEVADEVRNQRKGVLVSDGKGIDFTIVLYWS